MLWIKNLKCFYGNIMAVKGISLSVRRQEIVTLIGANGAGKTTLLSAILGLIPRCTGEIRFEDSQILGMGTELIVRSGISLVPEGRLIFPGLSVGDNLMLGAYPIRKSEPKSKTEERKEKILELFPRLKERIKQQAGTLSGGEQQMLAVGRALMANPRLLLLDEPSMGLAPIIAEKIFESLLSLRRRGITIILVEQNARAALEIADRGYVIETGSIVLQGASRDLLADEEVKRAYLGKDYGDFYDEY